MDVDLEELEQELKKEIEGEVRFDEGSKGLYSTDSSNYRQIPLGVVIPKTEADVIKTVELCHKYKAPILSRGGGTSLAGQCCNVAVVIDMSKYYNQVLHFDPQAKLVKVQPGIVLDEVNDHVKDEGLIFGPDPATHSHCTIGGMLGNNSCGVHSVMAEFAGNGARVEDNIESLTILTYDGLRMEVGPVSGERLEEIITEGGRKSEIYRQLKDLRDFYTDKIKTKFPDIPRRVSGYNLPELLPEKEFNLARALVGSEGTCAIILDATLKLIPSPEKHTLVVLGFDSIHEAGEHVPEIMKYKPIGLEGMDDMLISFMKRKNLHVEDIEHLPEGKGWLLVEFGGKDEDDVWKQANKLIENFKKKDNAPNIKSFESKKKEALIWEVRESGLGATAWVPGEPSSVPGWEDSAVPPEKIGGYLKALRDLFAKYDYHPALYGHFGQGCVHCRVEFDLLNEEGLEKYKKFSREAAHLVVKFGGSLSGEHGDGQSRADLLEIMYGKEIMQAFHDFKQIWDPEWKMNPGKIINGYGQTANLRAGNDYNPKEPETHFSYPEDNGSFSHATLRCVGVGQCRRHNSGIMCPSYMVTREEKHSTRGRARLLHEMLEGDVVKNGWKNEAVKEALDLCLACKGCKGDCPVSVDMATYKAEFLSHYYKGKIRPRTAYAFGLIYWWARLASLAPQIVNWASKTPILSDIIKFAGGIAPKRDIPRFAKKHFRKWFNDTGSAGQSNKPKVILWPDTFNNFLLPDTLKAGKNVLEAAGFQVILPQQMLCCGRPLYDYGMLDKAKKLLKEILQNLRHEIQAGVPVVGMEPSCVAVFRDELCNLIPHNHDAQRLKSQTFTLAEFLLTHAMDFELPKLKKKAIIHRHCHHQAIMHFEEEKQVLNQMELDYEILDSGCCGMAGSFGYEKGERYDVSIKAGERVLLPRIREADNDTIIIADGFSCREQIKQCTSRKAWHLAEVIDMALKETVAV
nr:FAD-binding and (Fe-S)-binding domain-containing protein [Fulvivirga kasyanovii]